MRRSIWPLWLIAVLIGACAPAASPQASETANTPAVVQKEGSATTLLQFAVSTFQPAQYEDLIEAFEAENPGVHVSIVPIEEALGTGRPGAAWPSDGFLRLAAAADVIAAPATRQAVEQGALLDLTQFFESDPSLNADAFYPGLLDSVQWNGKIWSVPSEASYSLLYYDKKLFDAAGVAYPEPGWTWDDFLATAQALTVGSGDSVSQWGFVSQSFDPVTFVQARAGLLFDPEPYPPAARLDDAAVIEAVRWYTDLYLTHKVAPYYAASEEGGPGRMFDNESQRLIRDGQAAIWFTGGGMGGMMMRGGGPGGPQEQQSYGVVPFPVRQAGDRTTPAVVNGFSISAGTQHANLAWKWISYLVQQRVGQRGRYDVLMGRAVPALASVAEASGYWDALDEDLATAQRYALEHAYVDNYGGTGYEPFNAAVLAVMDDGVAVETAMADAQTEVEAVIEEEVAAAPTAVANLVVAQQEQQALDSGAVILDFGLAQGPGRFAQQSMTTLVEQFQEAHPEIIVEIGSPEGFRGQLDLADMAAEFDCFEASPTLNDESIAAIVNIEPFLASDATTRKEDFYPAALEQFSYQGQLWGLPADVSVSLIYYNKDLFDAANLAYPVVSWTTSDFLQMAVTLTKGDGATKQYGYVPGSFGANDLVSIMDRLGAEMLDESVDPPRLVFSSPDVADALRFYTSLVTEYKVTPTVEETDRFGNAERERQAAIDEGRAGMWLESGGGGGFQMGIGGGGPGRPGGPSALNTGVAPLPSGPNSAKGSGFQSVDGYFISAQSDARQACWAWITFLTEQPALASGLPARTSVAECGEYRQRVGEERADAYLASLNSGSRPSFYQRISDEGNWLGFASFWLSDAYERVISGERTVEESLSAAQESVDSFRDCVIAKDAYQDPELLQQCLSEAGGNMMIGGGGPP